MRDGRPRLTTVRAPPVARAAIRRLAMSVPLLGRMEKLWFRSRGDQRSSPTRLAIHGQIPDTGARWQLPAAATRRASRGYNLPACRPRLAKLRDRARRVRRLEP